MKGKLRKNNFSGKLALLPIDIPSTFFIFYKKKRTVLTRMPRMSIHGETHYGKGKKAVNVVTRKDDVK